MKLKIQDLSLQGKKVLLRVDFNTPLDSFGAITDDSRIKASLPTIRFILEKGGSVILLSHIGRPQGKQPSLSLNVCANKLQELLEQKVVFIPDCVGEKVKHLIKTSYLPQVVMLENLRFDPREERPDPQDTFAKEIASLGDVYVNDAFSVSHRFHSSITNLPKYFPSAAAMGLQMQKELFSLEPLKKPSPPFFMVIGGAKISTKIGLLESSMKKASAIYIGGAMAFPFFKAQNISLGSSLCANNEVEKAEHILHQSLLAGVPLHFPYDMVISKGSETHVVNIQEGIPEGWRGVDIGPQTITHWAKDFTHASTIFWNGPMGIFEQPPFALGTKKIAETLAHLPHTTTVAGGGDSVAALNELALASRFSYVSMAGGALLEFLESFSLPGIDALTDFP